MAAVRACLAGAAGFWRTASARPIFRRMQPLLAAERPLADTGRPFQIHSEFQPAGDQPQAIDELAAGLAKGERDQVLLGVTGSGKTFTMAHVIARLQRPALILATNKTLAAQLYGEMKSFFQENAVCSPRSTPSTGSAALSCPRISSRMNS